MSTDITATHVRSKARTRTTVIGLFAVWVVARTYMVVQLGYFRGGKVEYQDLNVFFDWAKRIVSTHTFPGEPAWQYPPAALLAFLPPLLSPNYFVAFIALVLLADLGILIALTLFAVRSGRSIGAWVWVLAIPAFGTLPLLRFDVIPTAIAVIALCLPLSKRRSEIFGALVGLGIAVKAWPVLVMLSITSRRSLLRSGIVAAIVVAVIVIVSAFLYGNSLGFLFNQSGRGLELEAVAATPWYLVQAVTGHAVSWLPRNGSLEINSDKADAIASALRIVTALAALAVALWWFRWTKTEYGTPQQRLAIGRDAAFTAVLIFVVVNPVLSPQYLIWLVGLGAVALTSRGTSVQRPVVMMLIAVLLTQALLATWGDLVSNGANGAYLVSARNLVLVLAAIDAVRSVWRASRRDVLETSVVPMAEPSLESSFVASGELG